MGDQKSKDPSSERLRQIPPTSQILTYPSVKKLLSSHRRSFVLSTIRELLAAVRERILAGEEADVSRAAISAMISEAIESAKTPTLRRVINATGVILHTGLGRAPMSDRAAEAVKTAASNYCNLELHLDTGRRGTRQTHVERLICGLTGSESALVVNNNAAAVLLSLHSIASGHDVLVSRGELIEIGGSFRLPEIMEKSGCTLVEVGTTNRTTLSDYRQAAGDKTGLLLKVHASNYEIVGFAERVGLRELVELGRELNIPVMYDLGSGALVPMDSEPVAEKAIEEGVDVITFSADKLLGGPQAGIIAGTRQSVDRMKRDPLARAMRVCKLTLAALQATLLEYLTSRDILSENPTMSYISRPVSQIEKAAAKLAAKLKKACGDLLTIEVADDSSMIGGGAFPTRELPTKVVTVLPVNESVDELARKLRLSEPPIVGRVANEKLLLDIRTIRDSEHKEIVSAFQRLVAL